MAQVEAADSGRKNLAERTLAALAQVQVSEGAGVLLLVSYYLLKTVREPLILTQGGAEVKTGGRCGGRVIVIQAVNAS